MSSKQLAKQRQYEQLEKGEKLGETTRGKAFDWTDQFSRLDWPYPILFV